MELAYKEIYPTNPTNARKRIVPIDQHTQNSCETAQRCKTSPQRVRQWVKHETIRRTRTARPAQNPPNTSPEQPTPTNKRVLQRHQKTHYGRQHLARHLTQHGIHLSPNTIRHSLRRHAPATDRPRKQRRRLSPAHGAWATQEPFTLIQADGKAISDTGTLGTERWHHLRKHCPPRYQ
jgi:hypothetical protein